MLACERVRVGNIVMQISEEEFCAVCDNAKARKCALRK